MAALRELGELLVLLSPKEEKETCSKFKRSKSPFIHVISKDLNTNIRYLSQHSTKKNGRCNSLLILFPAVKVPFFFPPLLLNFVE